MKSWLILHPEDSTTKFLRGLYLDLPNKSVITGGITKSELRKYIQSHDRCMEKPEQLITFRRLRVTTSTDYQSILKDDQL